MEEIPCTYRISVKAIIKDNTGRILLLKERDGKWDLPGGGLEHGENPKDALKREIIEETRMTVDWTSEQPVSFWSIRKEVGSHTIKWFAFLVYEANVSGVFSIDPSNDEAQDAKYFSINEAKDLDLHENSKPYFA